MAQPKLQANFFASSDGIIVKKSPQLTQQQRKLIFDRDKGQCQICRTDCIFGGGNTVSPFQEKKCSQVDHIFPRSRGGNNLEENLRLLCVTCNSKKGAK